jgi:plastocyanin
MTSRWGRLLGIGATAILFAGSCTDTSSGPTTVASETTGTREPQDVSIVAVDYAYAEAPTELEAGVIDLTFENEGTVYHEVALTGIGDTPLQRYVDDLGGGNGLEGNPFPEYIDQVLVPPFVSIDAGLTAEATFTLTPGRYALFCAIEDVAEGDEAGRHYLKGMIRELTVTGGDAEPELPEADGTIVATDYSFEVDVEAGDRSVNFLNEGPDQVHVTAIGRYPVGIDQAEAAKAFLAKLEPGPPPEGLPRAEEFAFSGMVSAGLGNRLEFDANAFESGRTYVLACQIADREGGKPHVRAYHQYTVFTVE